MNVEFVINGLDYSAHKSEFKKLLAKYGLKWAGTMGNAVWKSSTDTVHAIYDRDEERDITLQATLRWEGARETKFLAELRLWASKQRAPEVPKTCRVTATKIEEELKFWDSIHKPDEEYLRKLGYPPGLIKAELTRWKKERKLKEKELRKKYG